MKIGLPEKAASHNYDTPPDGDFVRYVDQLLARHPLQSQAFVVPVAPGISRTAAKPAAASGSAVSTKADELLERIRHLEAARKSKGASSTPPVAQPGNSSMWLTGGKSTVQDPGSVFKWLGWAVMAILGVIFPPLGVLMLIGAIKKGLASNAKK